MTKIKERYFCKNSRRGLFRNGVSRLWWGAYLSYNDFIDDKYKLTRVLFSDEDLFTGLMERDYSMCKNVIMGILSAFNDYKERNSKLPSRECRRALYIYINQQGALTLLDYLSVEDIYSMVLSFIIGYSNKNE